MTNRDMQERIRIIIDITKEEDSHILLGLILREFNKVMNSFVNKDENKSSFEITYKRLKEEE